MEAEMKMLSNELLVDKSKRTFGSGKKPTSENLLSLASFFQKHEDNPLACELICCSVSIAIHEYIEKQGLKIRFRSLEGMQRFVSNLSRDLGCRFGTFEMCHIAFFTDSHGADSVKIAISLAESFLSILADFEVSEAKKMELEKTDFDRRS